VGRCGSTTATSEVGRITLISLAGPALNLLFAVVLAVPFMLGLTDAAHFYFWAALAFFAFLQLTAALLNLLPVPGLDGANALRPWLSPEVRRGFDAVAPYGMLLLFVVVWNPAVNGWFFRAVDAIAGAMGVPPLLYGIGWHLFRFWS